MKKIIFALFLLIFSLSFSNYKLAYSFDKKNRPKMSINRISDNKKICNLSIN